MSSPQLSPEEMRGEVLGLMERAEDGVALASEVQRVFGPDVSAVKKIVKDLLEAKTIEVCEATKGKKAVAAYRLVSSKKKKEKSSREVLTQEQNMVLNVVERAGNTGVWLRDIKAATSLQQQTLNKALRVLETQKMVKTVKSVQQKTRKLYMAFDLQPTREISGGPWYTAEQEFDHGYVDELKAVILRFIRQTDVASIDGIEESLKMMKISKVPLEPRDVETLVDALVCDNKIEKCKATVTDDSEDEEESDKKRKKKRKFSASYKIAREVNDPNTLTTVPCGKCPNRRSCRPGGLISPDNCLYFDKWLAAPDIIIPPSNNDNELQDLEDIFS